MIEADGLTKLYGDFAAVSDLSFTVQPGEVLGLVGPNGAGKAYFCHKSLSQSITQLTTVI